MNRKILTALCVSVVSPALAVPQGTTPPLTDATNLTITVPNIGTETVPAAISRTAGAQVWRPITQRAKYPDQGLSDGRRACATYRQYFVNQNRAKIIGIKIRYTNAWGTPAQGWEQDGPNNLTIRASLETNVDYPNSNWGVNASNILLNQFRWGSGLSGTLVAGGGTIESDPLMIPVAAGQSFYIRTYVCADGTKQWPLNVGLRGNWSESTNSGYFASTFNVSATTTPGTTLAPLSVFSVSQLPVVLSSVQITGPGITGIMTDNGSGVLSATGSCSSGTITYATGVVALSCGAPQTGTYNINYFAGPSTTVDATMIPGSTDFYGLYQLAYGPTEVLGLLAPNSGVSPYGVLLVGDSIMSYVGNGDNVSFADYCGMTSASSNIPRFGVGKISQHSEAVTTFIQGSKHERRLSIPRGEFDRVIENYGSNDCTTYTGAQVIAAKTALWEILAPYLPHGQADIWVATILPRTNSSNVAVAGFGSSSSSCKNQVNAWLYTQAAAGNIAGVIDTAAVVESSPGSQTGTGSGTWASGAYTSDWVHPTNAADLAICAVVGAYGSSPSPAFIPPY